MPKLDGGCANVSWLIGGVTCGFKIVIYGFMVVFESVNQGSQLWVVGDPLESFFGMQTDRRDPSVTLV